MELYILCKTCKGEGRIWYNKNGYDCPDCDEIGYAKATKADILRAAKELIEVSDEEIDQLVDSVGADDGYSYSEKWKKEDRQTVRNFISSLFEEKTIDK